MSRRNFNNKKLLFLFSLILICLLSLTIAYSVLGVILNISGFAQVSGSSWKIYLDNINITSGSVDGPAPTITTPTSASFSVELNLPGDYYEFTIDVVNAGSIDAILSDIVKVHDLTEEESKFLNYSIDYEPSNYINSKPLISSNSSLSLVVRVEYLKDITLSDLPTSAIEIDLSFNVYCSQTNSVRYEDSEGNSNFGIIDENTYVYLSSSSPFNAVPGMTLYDAINDRIKDSTGHGVNDYSYYNLDGQWIYVNIEDGRRYNLKNTIIELGKTYYSSAWNYTVNVNDMYASNDLYHTVFVDMSIVSGGTHSSYYPVLAGLDDTYLNIVHASYPVPLNVFAPSATISSREQDILFDKIVAYPAGQAGGCGATKEHEFYFITDVDDNLLNLSSKVNHLDMAIPINVTISQEEMTYEEAKAAVEQYYLEYLQSNGEVN